MKNPRQDIFINDDQDYKYISFKLKRLIKQTVRYIYETEGKNDDCEVSITFKSNGDIEQLNDKYRNIAKPTDVLSFPLDDYLLGDVFISTEKADEQAAEYGHSFDREVIFLCIHGILHLLGYDHEKSESDEKIMFDKQKEILSEMGIAD
jgi:probable rRNA maturation factor